MKAIVGTYLHIFVKFPRHNAENPSFLTVLTKQSEIPVYATPFLANEGLTFCVCNNNFTLSIGAHMQSAIVVAIPPSTKSVRKLLSFDIS